MKGCPLIFHVIAVVLPHKQRFTESLTTEGEMILIIHLILSHVRGSNFSESGLVGQGSVGTSGISCCGEFGGGGIDCPASFRLASSGCVSCHFSIVLTDCNAVP